MKVLIALLIGALLTVAPGAAPAQVTEIMVVASVHGLHRTSPGYSYETLYRLVEDFRPDFVGVEIRPEDMARDDAYLGRNYPREMRELARRYGVRAFGVDWLGEDIAGQPVADDWWQTRSPVKALERDMAADRALDRIRTDAIQLEQQALFAGVTPAAMNDGRYDRLTADYYRAFRQMLEGTRYQAVAAFYAERDRRIGENIARMIAANPGRRFVVVLGADHRGFAIDHLRARFGDAVRIVPVADPA